MHRRSRDPRPLEGRVIRPGLPVLRSIPLPVTRGERRRFAHTGSEPVTARSDLPARRLLARLFGAAFLLATAGFSLLAAMAEPHSSPGRTFFVVYAGICAGFVLVAAVDLVVIRRRELEQRRWGRM
ncbi:hypothetical protein [Streptacidiphilus sp. EB129]|uniref:hypothetical protein n=1 Tax=Streptacidiphilus sp. EB129 TaxID=3156262 RepID=UPI00351325D2